MLNNIIIKDNKIQIGGYILPADFKYLEKDFLLSLDGKDFSKKVEDVYFKLTGKKYKFDKNVDISMIDDSICALDLSLNKNANYLDVIFDNENFSTQIYSLISIISATYLDLIESEVISKDEKINFAIPSNEGLLVLALFIAKKIGLPIETIMVGSKDVCHIKIDGMFFTKATDNDIEDFIGVFFDEYDIAIDPVSVKGIVSIDAFYNDFDDQNVSIYLNLISPYLFAKQVLSIMTGERVNSDIKAIDKLYLETSQEIPLSIENKEIPLNYEEKVILPFDIAISFINALIKV